MAQVRRYDAGTLAKAQRLPNGMLRCPATLTRTGVFEYRIDGGKLRRELRLPEEVFRADALESFACVPVTYQHPDPTRYPHGVTADNARDLQVGQVGDSIRRDGQNVTATIMLTDSAAIKAVDAGKVALSCGYECDCEESPGEWQGQRYDAIQRNICGNHVAIVDTARAGPEARLHLDGEQISTAGDQPAAERTDSKMEKIVIDGIELEVSKPAAQAFTKIQARADSAEAALKSTKADLEKTAARADAAEKSRADAADPKRLDALVAARVDLLGKAREVLGTETKLDGMGEQEIKLAVIAKLDPEFKADGKSADYVAAYFDAALKTRGAKAAPIARVDPERQDGSARQDHRADFAKELAKQSEKAQRTDSAKQ